MNLNPYFRGFRSGAASSDPLRNLSRSHFHNQCHPFILRYDSHPHHPTHQRVIVSRYFTKFLPFFSRANCWSRILSTPVVVLLFILELPSIFFRSRADPEFGSLDDRFSCFQNPIGIAGPSHPALDGR